MRRSGHPSRPRAITCCFFASLKTLLISTKATCLTPKSTSRASFSLAGFQVTLIGRFWVTPEVPVRGVGRHRFWFSSLPLREASEHVLRGHRFLTHPCCRRLYSHDDATVVVDQIVVVVPQPSRRAALGGVSRIGIGGRYLVLLVNRFFQRILLLQFHQILSHRLTDLRRFR